MHAGIPLFMYFYAWDFTGGGLGATIYNNFKGGFEIRETPTVYEGSRVPGSSETNPALQKRKNGTNICLKIYMYIRIHIYLPSWRWVRLWNILERYIKQYSQFTH